MKYIFLLIIIANTLSAQTYDFELERISNGDKMDLRIDNQIIEGTEVYIMAAVHADGFRTPASIKVYGEVNETISSFLQEYNLKYIKEVGEEKAQLYAQNHKLYISSYEIDDEFEKLELHVWIENRVHISEYKIIEFGGY